MYAPTQDDEITGLVNYCDQQLTAIRSAAYGLTEEQATSTPCSSALSIGGLIKHASYCMRGAIERLQGADAERALDADAFAEFTGSFAISDDTTVAATIEEFDALRKDLLSAMAATDPSAEGLEPPAPWHGIFDARPIKMRFYLVHLIEEFARHSGHADIIREQIDGMAVPALVMSLAGAPANDFFQPYQPAEGTLLS